jgi:type IV pilus assembly protein PilB
MAVNLGELLLRENMVTPPQLQEALARQKTKGGKLARAFVELGHVGDEEIAHLLARHYGIPSISLPRFAVDPLVLRILPAETCRKYQALPLSRSGATLTVAFADPTNVFAMDDIRLLTGCRVEPVVAPEIALDEALEKYSGGDRGLPPGGAPSLREVMNSSGLTFDDMASIRLLEVDVDSIADEEADAEPVRTPMDEIDLGSLARSTDAAPMVKLSHVLLIDALKRGAAEIHVEPYEKEFRVRFRIDGVLHNVMALPLKLRDPLISRLKVMSRLDISEKRRPQQGRIRIRLKIGDRTKELEFLVSVLPTAWGEKTVLRSLDRARLLLDRNRLGFEPAPLEAFQRALARRSGLVLVTGPTDSGKANTLYAALASLNKPDVNITTLEDPVEYSLAGLNQVPLKEAIGLDSTTALRLLTGQEPDVILVGPIRDGETARLASKLALTGHLVLAALREQDGSGAIETLAAMGAPASTLARALQLTLAQRLVRRLCDDCREEVEVSEDAVAALVSLGLEPGRARAIRLPRGRGCGRCDGTGYRGRIGLFEAMPISPALREAIAGGATAGAIRTRALHEGMFTLRMSGLEKIEQGITTIDEVRRQTAT